MAVSLGKLESELYELAKEFPHLRPCGSSPKRFTTYCPIHGKEKTSDVKWRFEGDELVITCEVCGPLTLDQIRNPKPVVSEVKPSVTTIELPIASITVDTRAQSRDGIDVDLVSEYADAMREGAIFPPMTVFDDGTTYWLSEGFHRFYAYAKIEATHCSCVVKQGGLREAILLSVGSNSEHGKRRSNADKRRSVELLLKDEDWRSWSDREIGKQCSVSHEFVRQLRSDLQSNEDAICQPLTDTASIQEPEEVVPKATDDVRTATRAGTTYKVKTGNIGKPKKVVNPIDSAIKLAVGKVFDEMDGELSDEKGIDLALNILNGLGNTTTEELDNLTNSTTHVEPAVQPSKPTTPKTEINNSVTVNRMAQLDAFYKLYISAPIIYSANGIELLTTLLIEHGDEYSDRYRVSVDESLLALKKLVMNKDAILTMIDAVTEAKRQAVHEQPQVGDSLPACVSLE